MSALPPLNALRAFEAAARHGSFVAAARELNVTPAAIGQQVRQLEALIGAPLFERTGRALILTERGAAGLDRLSRAFELVGEANAAMRDARQTTTVTLSCPAAFQSAWLAPRLGAQRDRSFQLDVLSLPADAAFDAGAEIVVEFTGRPASHYDSVLLFSETLTPVATPDLAATILDVERLELAPLIEEIADGLGWRTWLTARGAYGVAQKPAFRCHDPRSVVALSEAGAGVGLVRRSHAHQAILDGRLAPLFAAGDQQSRLGYYALTRRDSRQSDAARDLLNWLRAQASAFTDQAGDL